MGDSRDVCPQKKDLANTLREGDHWKPRREASVKK